MKIGLLLTVYNCDKYIDAVLEPWFKLKEKYNIVIAANSGMFSDYLTLGIPYRNEKTLEKLSKWDIDFLLTTKGKNLLTEDEQRNTCLNYLKRHNCDLLWVIDGDEEYTVSQIELILEFIKKNQEPDYYSVNFKNLTIHEHLFMDYTHGRISWMNRHGGPAYFYFDNQILYEDGTNFNQVTSLEIPKNVAYVKHYSWLSNDTRSLDKIPYQRLRYEGYEVKRPEECRCQYEWNHEKNRLEFSKDFHQCRDIEIPILHEELLCYTHDVSIRFSRKQNAFHFEKVERDMSVDVEFYNGETGEFLYTSRLDMIKGVTYFIAILPTISFDFDPNFFNVEVKMFENKRLIHNEKMHLKFK